jgi:hypothetical protein
VDGLIGKGRTWVPAIVRQDSPVLLARENGGASRKNKNKVPAQIARPSPRLRPDQPHPDILELVVVTVLYGQEPALS